MSLRAIGVSLALAGCSSAPLALSGPVLGAESQGPDPSGPEAATGAAAEAVRVQLLDNGDFAQLPPAFEDAAGLRRIPWWKSAGGARQLVRDADGVELRTAPGEWALQPLAVWAPRVGELTISGSVRGRGVLVLRDGEGEELAHPVGADEEWVPFAVRLDDLAGPGVVQGAPGRTPRFELELRGADGETAHWRDVAAVASLPGPDREALRAEIVRELDWIFELWLARAADRAGPRSTAFLAQRFDVVTGAPGGAVPGGHNVFFDLLMRASAVHDEPRWRAAFERFLDDFFELSLDPATGLPRHWDVERDRALDAFIEVHETLRFLIDLAEDGPEEQRALALEAAQRIARTVLATGVLPDGRVAARYRPSDGQPNSDTVSLRQLDLPAQLGRLGALVGEEAYRDVALHALAVLEYTHIWPGTWDAIDPGFDDQYGHYGARAAVLWKAWPDERPFKRLAYAGLAHYFPLWQDALRLGGNVAADQVRCWSICLDVIELEPTAREHLAPVLADAARAHFKGEQYGNGAWGDVTHFGFDPQPHLQVGDLTGVPQNLLEGLALLHDEELAAAGGMPLEEVRARFAAVWYSTREHYRRPFGYLATREESRGENLSLGSLRVAVGLVTMLERL